MATFLPEGATFGLLNFRLFLMAYSPRKCSTELMPTWSSTSLRLHALSHGAGHTRPMTDGNGFASVRRRHAYSCHGTPCGGFSVPRTMASQPRMSSPEGQPAWHGGADCT